MIRGFTRTPALLALIRITMLLALVRIAMLVTSAPSERAARCALTDAQLFVARGHGFASWPKFAKHLEALARANSPISKFEAAVDAIVGGDLATLKKLLRLHQTELEKHHEKSGIAGSPGPGERQPGGR